MRQAFDLYACINRYTYSWFEGISTPVKHPENVNMVIFRENTEDVYAGIEYQAGSAEAEKLAAFLRSEFGAKIREASAIGIKPMSGVLLQASCPPRHPVRRWITIFPASPWCIRAIS